LNRLNVISRFQSLLSNGVNLGRYDTGDAPGAKGGPILATFIAGAVAFAVIVSVATALFIMRKRRRQRAAEALNGSPSRTTPLAAARKIVVGIILEAGLPLLDEDDVVAERSIGQGAYGMVYSARWKNSSALVAVKVLQLFGVTPEEIENGARAISTELTVLNAAR
jgi:hypothetical protein